MPATPHGGAILAGGSALAAAPRGRCCARVGPARQRYVPCYSSARQCGRAFAWTCPVGPRAAVRGPTVGYVLQWRRPMRAPDNAQLAGAGAVAVFNSPARASYGRALALCPAAGRGPGGTENHGQTLPWARGARHLFGPGHQPLHLHRTTTSGSGWFQGAMGFPGKLAKEKERPMAAAMLAPAAATNRPSDSPGAGSKGAEGGPHQSLH